MSREQNRENLTNPADRLLASYRVITDPYTRGPRVRAVGVGALGELGFHCSVARS